MTITKFHQSTCIILIAFIFLASAHTASSQDPWQVTHVVDGDTFYASDSSGQRIKCRLIGIDTPEYSHFGKPEEPYADDATEFLYDLIADKKVILEEDVQALDRYGRQLVYVYLPDSTFVNAELMKHGWATTMTISPNVSFADLFTELQSKARKAKRGIWQD